MAHAGRLREHNGGSNRSTAGGARWRLVLKEEYDDTKVARAREKYLKSGKGREEIASLLDAATTHNS